MECSERQRPSIHDERVYPIPIGKAVEGDIIERVHTSSPLNPYLSVERHNYIYNSSLAEGFTLPEKSTHQLTQLDQLRSYLLDQEGGKDLTGLIKRNRVDSYII